MNRLVIISLVIGLIVGGVSGYGSAVLGSNSPARLADVSDDEGLERVQSELTALQEELQKRSDSLDVELDKSARLNAELSQLRNELGGRDAQLAEIQESLRESRASLDQINEQLSQRSADLATRTRELNELRIELERVNRDLSSSATRIQELEGEVASLKQLADSYLRLRLGDIELVDALGNPIPNPQVGRMMVIQSKATNIVNRRITFAFHVSVTDAGSNRIIFEQSIVNLQLNEGGTVSPGIGWSTDVAGTYRIEVSAVDSLANMLPMSPPQTLVITLN